MKAWGVHRNEADLFRFFSAIIKIALASLIVGAGLSFFNVSAADILQEMGLTPETVFGLLQHGLEWAIPNLVLGSLVIVPIWLVVYLFRPPRGGRD